VEYWRRQLSTIVPCSPDATTQPTTPDGSSGRGTVGSSDQALTELKQAFGKCIDELPAPINTEGMRHPCVMANEDALDESDEPSGRLYMIGTAVRTDGSRVIGMVIKSR
jgi:hypothetical protein